MPAPSGGVLPRGEKGQNTSSPNKSKRLGKSRIRREFTTIRGKKRQKDKPKLAPFKPVFLDLQGSNFRFQSRGRNAMADIFAASMLWRTKTTLYSWRSAAASLLLMASVTLTPELRHLRVNLGAQISYRKPAALLRMFRTSEFPVPI